MKARFEDIYRKAISFASAAHRDQVRKYTGEAYVTHPIAVGKALAADGWADDIVIAGILHDVLEDTEFTRDDIRVAFGSYVLALVVQLTDVFTKEDYPHLNRKARKTAEADRLALCSAEAKAIKLADIKDNTASIIAHDPGFAKVYLAEKAYLVARIT